MSTSWWTLPYSVTSCSIIIVEHGISTWQASKFCCLINMLGHRHLIFWTWLQSSLGTYYHIWKILFSQWILEVNSTLHGGGTQRFSFLETLNKQLDSNPFLTFSMRFEFLSEMFDHPVSESRDPSLTIFDTSSMPTNLGLMIMTSCPVRVVGYVVTWPLLHNHNHYINI